MTSRRGEAQYTYISFILLFLKTWGQKEGEKISEGGINKEESSQSLHSSVGGGSWVGRPAKKVRI